MLDTLNLELVFDTHRAPPSAILLLHKNGTTLRENVTLVSRSSLAVQAISLHENTVVGGVISSNISQSS